MFPCVVFSTSVGRQCEFQVFRANLGHSGQQSWRSYLLHNKDKSISWVVLCSINTAAGTHCVHSSQGGFPSKSGSMVQSHSLRPTTSDITRVDCSGKCKLSRATSMTNPRYAIWCHQALIIQRRLAHYTSCS